MKTKDFPSSRVLDLPGMNSFMDSRKILTNACTGIFTSAPEERLPAVNQAMARMPGYESRDDLMASVFRIPADRDCFKRHIPRLPP